MKKKWLSLAMVLCFGISFAGGCSKESDSFTKLNLDGYDIVLKIGDKAKYTADNLFSDMLNTEEGVQTAYEKILKMIVENSIETDANMEASWDLMLDSFEEEVKTLAATEGISEKEARKNLLAEDGYGSIQEKKEAYFYEIKLSKMQENYWNERMGYYFEKYFNDRLPYYVKHVLVKTGYTAARGPYASIIDTDDANDLFDVYSMLAKGEKFSYIMNHKSEDTGSVDGTGYHMDLTTSFVTEFLHGVFVLDSLLKNETAKVSGLTSEVLDYYVNSTAGGKDYNFNVIHASDIVALKDNASSSQSNSISAYKKDDENKDVSAGTLSNSSLYGTTSSLYTKSIIFNQTFNNPGISVIAYDLNEEIPGGKYMELTINGENKKLLTDEKGNLVFVVCAKGSSSDLWVHFLTVDVSPFDNKSKLFYSLNQEETIKEMVAAKKVELEANNSLSEADITSQLKDYEDELKEYQTYVDIKGGETQKGRNAIVEELEAIVMTYAKRGITSEAVPGEEQFITYDMVEYYMDKGDVTITNENVKRIIEQYIANQKALIDYNSMNSIVEGWDEYYDRVMVANSDEVLNRKIPIECSYGTNKDAVCTYNYDEDKGFKINITYNNSKDTSANVSYMPTNSDSYVTSFYIGDGIIELPGIKNDDTDSMHREGYTFAGWYTSSGDDGELVTHIDASRSSSKNKVVLYAKWTPNSTGGDN